MTNGFVQVCACGCIGVIHLVSPPLPVLISCRLESNNSQNGPTGMRMKEADWKAFNTVKPVTDVSTVDIKDIPVSSVSKIKTHSCSLPAKSHHSTSRTAFFPTKNKCMLLQMFCFPNNCQICYGNLDILYLSHALSGRCGIL